MELMYYTFRADEDGHIYAVMRTNTKDVEQTSHLLQVTLHAEESPEAITASDNQQSYRLEQDSDGAVQLTKKEAE